MSWKGKGKEGAGQQPNLERGVLQSRGVGLLQLPMRLHECLRNVAPTELSKVRVLAAGGIPHIHDLGVVGDVRSPGLNGRGHHEGEGFELGLPVHGGHAIHHSSLDGVDDGRTHHHSVREGGHLLHLGEGSDRSAVRHLSPEVEGAGSNPVGRNARLS